jgi:ketosteroid isomerase-like protein
MSEQNVEIVRRSLELFKAGKFEEAFALYDPQVEWDASHFPEGRVYHGHEGIREFFRRYLGTWESFEIEFEEYFDAGEVVVVFARDKAVGRGSGVPVEFVYAQLLTLRDGKVTHWKAFTDREAALEAAGLTE